MDKPGPVAFENGQVVIFFQTSRKNILQNLLISRFY